MEPAESRLLPDAPDSAQMLFGDTLRTMVDYAALLASTGVDHGLIGPREVPRLWERHLLNCGVLSELIPCGATVADVGSGAGLPGLVLAISRPDLRLTLIEPLQRRVTWLDKAIDDLALGNVSVRRDRADQATDVQVEFVTSRAVAALPKLAQWCLPLLRDRGTMLALKGSSAEAELVAAEQALKKAGATSTEVVHCGVSFLDPPATVVRVQVGARPRRNVPIKRAAKKSSGEQR